LVGGRVSRGGNGRGGIGGENVFRNVFAGFSDIVGGRSAGYERSLRGARETPIGGEVAEPKQTGTGAVIGVDIDY